MFEQHHQPLLSRSRFARRMAGFLIAAVTLDAVAVGTGALGYHYLEGLSWLDACLEGALIITGNGPIAELRTPGGKVFAILDAVVGGIVFVAVVGVLLTPVFHRVLHAFHLEVKDHATK
ncbi:MAG TPA: two pore domain potassium channel family protein [Verrucomicrobiae bacterium]|nr:two pore domain potassium channel family protein [Verrucomicrobiae bacterium]